MSSSPVPTIADLRRSRDDALSRCQEGGKMEDFEMVLSHAEEALNTVQKIKKQEKHPDDRTSREDANRAASLNGYKGYALMKQGLFASAIHYLELSRQLRQNKLGRKNNDGEMPTKIDTKTNSTREPRSKSPKGREEAVVEQALKHCYQKVDQRSFVDTVPDMIKYPRTTHLFDSGGTATTSDDLVLSSHDLTSFLSAYCNGRQNVIIEEKVDGANLGISTCPVSGKLMVQNRTHYITSGGEHMQFSRITEWIEEHRPALTAILQGGESILYGEWVVARHTIPYKRLPGLFVAFDIYDKVQHKFYSRTRFHTVMKTSGIGVVPTIQSRTFGSYSPKAVATFRQELIQLLSIQSVFRNDGGAVEGVVLRVDENGGDWMQDKFKIVRPDFTRECNDGHHWQARQIEKQAVDNAFAKEYLQSCYVFAS